MADTVVIAEDFVEESGHRFSWALALAGGVAATAVTFFLLTLGAGFGLLLVRPATTLAPSFLTAGAIYFFVAQAFGFAVGGHFAGRLLGPETETHAQEEFRAAAHGFAAWAVAVLATLAVVIVAGLVAAGSGAGIARHYGAGPAKTTQLEPTAYLVDKLFRPGESRSEGRTISAADYSAETQARAEAGRLLEAGAVNGGQAAPDDRERLVVLVEERARITRDEAAGRVDGMLQDMQVRIRNAADIARRAASYSSLWIAASLLFGAVVAMAAAVFARELDDREAVIRAR
jgi:hypothetical protein